MSDRGTDPEAWSEAATMRWKAGTMEIVAAEDPRIEVIGAPGTFSLGDGSIRVGRVPRRYAEQIASDFMHLQADSSAGVRVRFATTATRVVVRLRAFQIEYEGFGVMPANLQLIRGAQRRTQPVTGGVVRILGEGTSVEYGSPLRSEVVFDELEPTDQPTEILLPPGAVFELEAFETDAPVVAATPSTTPVWVHHGSSISHCSTMADASATWTSVAADELGLLSINLSLSGNAQLDPFMARVIADTPADLISLKLGINLVNFGTMTLRAFAPAVHGWLDTIREKQPSTPILVISPVFCRAVETTPGPTRLDPATYSITTVPIDDAREPDALTLERIRAELARIVETRRSHDRHLHYLDGRILLDEEDDLAGRLPDGIHPDEEGYRMMGVRFAQAYRSLAEAL